MNNLSTVIIIAIEVAVVVKMAMVMMMVKVVAATIVAPQVARIMKVTWILLYRMDMCLERRMTLCTQDLPPALRTHTR